MNTGEKNGAVFLLEEKLKKTLLYLPCRHHIYELILRDIFMTKLLKTTTSPNVPIFDEFKKAWDSVDQNSFQYGLTDKSVVKKITKKRVKEIKIFCMKQLYTKQPRDDYRKFLELMILFLGGDIPRNKKFSPCGPIHHARWMAKAIYSLKIYLFRDQFVLTDDELNGFRDICIFLTLLYVEAWYTCKSGVDAPNNDLNFIKKAIDYKKIDKIVSNLVLKKNVIASMVLVR